jgi:glycosyltransferase involved in cell wall biosynthesis
MTDLASLRICFIAGLLGQGGAERQLFYILKSLREQGATPHVLCLTRGDFWEEKIRQLGIPVTWVGQARSRLKRLTRIVRELKNIRPAVFQSQHFFTNSYAIAAGRLCGLPDIGAMRSNGVRELSANGSIMGWLSLRAPRVVAANSLAGIRYAVARGIPERKLYFLPNVVDTENFKPAAEKPEQPIRLIAVGRLVKEKRFDRFVSVLAKVREQSKQPVTGMIVGPSDPRCDLRPELIQQANALGLDSNAIEFRGAVANMAPLFQTAHVCVLTSDFEGTPNVVMEAMASGLPVVATNVGGVPEILQNGKTGFVTERSDEIAMSKALVCLIENQELRRKMGEQARSYIETKHSFNRLPAFLSSLYHLALA